MNKQTVAKESKSCNSKAHATVCLECTHIHEQGQASDPLHGQDEEGDHGEVPAVWVAFYPGQHLLKSWILGPAGGEERVGMGNWREE